MFSAIQQQQARKRIPVLIGQPWRYWTPEEIARITGAPLENVLTDWPVVYAAFWDLGDGMQDGDILKSVQAAAIATIAIETASTFKPVREAYWLDDAHGYAWAEQWRRNNLRYWPYYGRGYVQLTWESNYRAEGDAIGIDLVSEPDRALDSWIAADAIARYFQDRGVNDAAIQEDWPLVRSRVQGAYAGLDRLQAIVAALGV